MNLEEAKKKVKAEKPRDHYMRLQISGEIVVPYRDGVQILSALVSAEKAPEYYKQYRISELSREAITSSVITYQEYDRHKLAALLNVTPDEVKEAEDLARKAQQQTP